MVCALWAIPVQHMNEGYEKVPLSEIKRLSPSDPTDAFDLCEKAFIKKPLHAEPFMNGIDGDDSALSYLAASFLAREAMDVEAGWHGVIWGHYTVLYLEPWKQNFEMLSESPLPKEKWNMKELPKLWSPEIIFDGDIVKVRFRTYTGLSRRRIHEFTDTYARRNYSFKSEMREIGRAGGGYMV